MSDGLSPIGSLLRQWRGSRGMSQLDLALSADVSSRHLSFVETGRSKPSREMVMRLGETLDLPLRERNAMLHAAGFAPAFGESELSDSELAPVNAALKLILDSHNPYPAFVMDSVWNLRLANRSYGALLTALLPNVKPNEVNVMQLIFDPKMLRPLILDWELVASVLGSRVRRQLLSPCTHPGQRRKLEELLAFPGVEESIKQRTPPPESVVLIPLEIRTGDVVLSWFSTIATIGTPQDITLEELRIESLFPANEATAKAVKHLTL